MKKPMHIKLPKQRRGTYTKPFDFEGTKHINAWLSPAFDVYESYYDLSDIFISVIEIRCQSSGGQLPLQCSLHDLYWFYPLAGALTLVPDEYPEQPPISLLAGHVTLVYLPPGNYSFQFQEEDQKLLYLVIKREYLVNSGLWSSGQPAALFSAFSSQINQPLQVGPFPISTPIAYHVSRIFRAFRQSKVEQQKNLISYPIDLVRDTLSHVMAHEQSIEAKVSFEEIREFILREIDMGNDAPIQELADRFGLSYNYTRVGFQRHFGIGIGLFIRLQKLEKAKELLAEGHNPTEAALYINMFPNHFNRNFKKRFGLSPSEYARTVREH